MLRESSQTHEQDVAISAVMTGDNTDNIKFGRELSAFAEAMVMGDVDELARARDNLVTHAGSEVMIDAAGVASNFQRMVRIADSTGIVLGRFEEATVELREQLDINRFAHRAS